MAERGRGTAKAMVEINDAAEPVSALKPALELAPDASLALACLAGGVALVFKRYPRVATRGVIRPNVEAAAERLRQYSQGFMHDRQGRRKGYVVTYGPQVSGKTTVVEAAFGGKRYAGYHFVLVDQVRGVDFQTIGGWVGEKWMTTETRLRLLDRFCRVVYRHPYVAVIELHLYGNGNLDAANLKYVASQIDAFGQSTCHDTLVCPVVFETSVPQLADAIKKEASDDICKAIDVPPMSLEEFKVCFAEYVMSNDWVPAILGYKPTTPPKSGWFGPNDESGKAYTAWANKILLHKINDGGPGINTVEDLATEYFYKVGPDVGRLTGLIEGKWEKRTFSEEIEIAHNHLKYRLRSLTDDEKQLVPKLLAAGPMGHSPHDVASMNTLLGRTTSNTLARQIDDSITLLHVGHVYALLMQEHNDDATVRTLMKQYGWVDMTDPKVTAGGA